jgi:hypothetical protein
MQQQDGGRTRVGTWNLQQRGDAFAAVYLELERAARDMG